MRKDNTKNIFISVLSIPFQTKKGNTSNCLKQALQYNKPLALSDNVK